MTESTGSMDTVLFQNLDNFCFNINPMRNKTSFIWMQYRLATNLSEYYSCVSILVLGQPIYIYGSNTDLTERKIEFTTVQHV